MSNFAIRDLGVLNYSIGFTSFVYKLGKLPLSDIDAVGFANDACGTIRAGDLIFFSSSKGGTYRVAVESEPGTVVLARLS